MRTLRFCSLQHKATLPVAFASRRLLMHTGWPALPLTYQACHFAVSPGGSAFANIEQGLLKHLRGGEGHVDMSAMTTPRQCSRREQPHRMSVNDVLKMLQV